jgi:hypothetical protein
VVWFEVGQYRQTGLTLTFEGLLAAFQATQGAAAMIVISVNSLISGQFLLGLSAAFDRRAP